MNKEFTTRIVSTCSSSSNLHLNHGILQFISLENFCSPFRNIDAEEIAAFCLTENIPMFVRIFNHHDFVASQTLIPFEKWRLPEKIIITNEKYRADRKTDSETIEEKISRFKDEGINLISIKSPLIQLKLEVDYKLLAPQEKLSNLSWEKAYAKIPNKDLLESYFCYGMDEMMVWKLDMETGYESQGYTHVYFYKPIIVYSSKIYLKCEDADLLLKKYLILQGI